MFQFGGREIRFCNDHFLSPVSLGMLRGSKGQVVDALLEAGTLRREDLRAGAGGANAHANNPAVVAAALAAGLYPHVARRAPGDTKLKGREGQPLAIHNASVNGGGGAGRALQRSLASGEAGGAWAAEARDSRAF